MSNFEVCLFQMIEKFSEDDRIDQMNAQKRRLKQQEHKRAVEKLIEERRHKLQQDKVNVVNVLQWCIVIV